MIIERLIKAPDLWNYVKDHLPSSLVADFEKDGYGGIYGITIKEEKKHFFDWGRPLIAYVEGDQIIVNHPNYFSDFERIGLEYEKTYRKQIKLKFWECP